MEDFFFDIMRQRDNLTNVYTRDVIEEYLKCLILENKSFSFALVDIDNFKYVNDTYGHITGDKILKIVAEKLLIGLRGIGKLGRFGGDEFMMVFPNMVNYDELWQVCHSLKSTLDSFAIDGIDDLYITITIGLARFPVDSVNYESLLELADKALYRGKMKGRNCFIIYLPEKHAQIDLKTEKEKSLSSMYLHSQVFRYLTRPKKLSTGIKSLFNYLCSYFMFDHICCQTEDKILFDRTHELSKNHYFVPVNLDLVKSKMNVSTEMYYINHIDQLLESKDLKLHGQLSKQKISSICYILISHKDKYYGMLRVDSTQKRIWQYGEMDILYTTAKLIGLLLYNSESTLETL